MKVMPKPIQWDVPEDMTYLVSNSEVSNYLSCERKHYYAHALNLEPINFSTSLSRGIIGHEALAAFYDVMQNDGSINLAVEMMEAVVDKYYVNTLQQQGFSRKTETLEMLTNLKALLTRYVEFQKGDGWRIIEVEQSHVMPLVDQYGYGMRLDLLVQMTNGPRAGEIWIVDHKFVYDFYSQDTLRINAQMPKYLATVRTDSGLVIKGGILNELRHRMKKGPMTDDELFRREVITPSAVRTRNIMKEQIKASEEIMERHALPVEEYGKRAKRVMNQMVCKNCSFLEPCMTELDGENISLMLKTEYKPNTYGYNKEAVDE
jgi:hypothetical protein